MSEPVPAHLVPTVSARGFSALPAISDGRGANVRVWESSAADGPHVWLNIEASPEHDVSAHLSLEHLQQLIDQAQWLIANHYQNG